MRVTKVIREYVEECVTEMYASKINNCSGDYFEKKKEVEKILEKMADEFDAAAKKVIEESGFSINSWYNGVEMHIIKYTGNFGDKQYSPIAKERTRLINERDRKIQDILVNLELGGTKAELDEMLKKIKEEVVG